MAGARYVGLEGTAFTLVLAGGVLRHPSSLLADAIIAQVRTTSPQVKPTRYRFEPIIGVLFTALENAEVAISEAVLETPSPLFQHQHCLRQAFIMQASNDKDFLCI